MSDIREQIAAALRASRGAVTANARRKANTAAASPGARRPTVVVADDLTAPSTRATEVTP